MAKAKASILIVDDVSANLHVMKRVLSDLDINIVEALSGEEALSAAIEQEFFLILLDVQMPDMDGFEVASILKDNPRTEHIPVIFVTAISKSDEFIAKGYAHGAVDYLTKPLNEDILVSKVNVFLDLYKQKTEVTKQHTKLNDIVKKIGSTQFALMDSQVTYAKLPTRIRFYPKDLAGGDSFARYKLSEDRHFLLMTDVSGHDLEAAFVSSYFQGYINGTMLDSDVDIKAMLEGFNDYLINSWNKSQDAFEVSKSIVVSGVLVDDSKKSATIYSCGACRPVLIDSERTSRSIGESAGYPLGWFEGEEVPVDECEFHEGSNIYFWSDGLESLASMLSVNIFSACLRLFELDNPNLKPGWVAVADDDILVIEAGGNLNNMSVCFFEEYDSRLFDGMDDYIAHWKKSIHFALAKCSASKIDEVIDSSVEKFSSMLDAVSKDEGARLSVMYQFNPKDKILMYVLESFPKAGSASSFKGDRYAQEFSL